MGDSETRLRRSTSPSGAHSVLVGFFVLFLLASGCAPQLGSRRLPSLPRETIIDVEEENYDVRGRTVEEIGRSLNASAASALAPGLVGLHHWDIRWRYAYRQGISNCEIVSVPIEIVSRIILPRWTQREGADPELVAMWDEYITALRTHEFTHRELSYLAARDFSRTLGRLRTPICATMPLLAESTGQRILDSYEERNRVFDEESRGTINWPPRAPVTVPQQQQQQQQQRDQLQNAAPQAIRKEAGLMVPMRDGVRLSTDLYFPADAPGPFSTVLIRTPYGKDQEPPYRGAMPLLVDAGYAVAFQDTRGRGVSEGEYTLRTTDREDGYDMVSWLVDQPWSDDKVATYGCSYLGETQITLAAERHPNHVAAMPMAPSAAYDPGGRPWTAFDGGAFELAQTAGWFMSGRASYRLELYSSLPVVDIVRKSGRVGSDYEDYASNTPTADYFQALDYVRPDDRFDVPALYLDSWYDYGVAETLKLFNQQREIAISARARDNQYVIIAPSTHCGFTRGPDPSRPSPPAGARDVGDWRIEFDDLYLSWYRLWLDGQDDGISDMPRVQYYLMGANEWRSADAWPVPGTSFEPFYLHSSGGANTLAGDGSLTTVPPGREPSDAFTYDPADPVPTLGGQACCTGMSTGAGGYDQTEIETRQDVLVYTSAVLEEGLEVTGPLEAVLYVSSDARDTDFTVKLVDVYPDGTAYNVQQGALRMRYREGLSTKVLMEEGEVYEARLDLHATGNYFGPGHRIRIEVSSSNFPRWTRNLNTGGNNFDETEWVVARNTVHHSAEYPSHVLLPIVRR